MAEKNSSTEDTKKICFVICPIGDPESETRRHSDLVLKHIIVPTAKGAGYDEENIIRADQISKPGIITHQIIEQILDADLVIADLTEHNPNVYYELAIRHAARKPVVLLYRKGERIPFDVAPNRAIAYDPTDWGSPVVCQKELSEQILEAKKHPNAENPISTTIDLRMFSQAQDPAGKSNAVIISMLLDIKTAIAEVLDNQSRVSRITGPSQIDYMATQKLNALRLAALQTVDPTFMAQAPEAEKK